jgi:hypothetical protein
MPTVITAEPTTGPETFVLRRLRKGNATIHTGIFRLREDGLWHSVEMEDSLTWDLLTENPAGHAVTMELLAVPPVTADPDLNISDVKRRMGLWNDAEHKWTSVGGRGLAVGLIKRELPMLIEIAEAATAPRAKKTEA